MFSRINKDLLPMKGHYFLYNAGTGPVVPYLSTYARQIGFSSLVVGVIYTIIPLCGMVAKPIAGAIADKFKCRKAIFLTAILGLAVSFVVLYYTPQLPVKRQLTFNCGPSAVLLNTCVGNSTSDLNQCAADELIQSSSEVSCQLECPMESEYWQTICQSWMAPQYCNYTGTFEFTAHIDLADTTQDNQCLHFKVSNATLDGSVHTPNCPSSENSILTVCDVYCDSYVLNDLIAVPELSDNDVYDLYQYWVFLFLMIFAWVFQAITTSTADAICFELLDDKPNKYGEQRLYGALGWGIFSFLGGVIIDAHSEGQATKNYISVFYLGAAFLVLNFIVAFNIKCKQLKRSPSIAKDVGRLFLNVRILIFLCWCIVVGMCTGLIWQFFFWLVEDLAEAMGCETFAWIKTLEGIIMAVQCLGGEMPFFFISGYILKRIGHVHSMSLVLVVIGIRYIAYSFIANPWYLLPLELLNGLTYGVCYACTVSYASIVSPPGTETTVQGLVGAVFEGIGVSVGSLVGGYLYGVYGGPLTFRMFGIGTLVAFVLHVAVHLCLSRGSSGDPLKKCSSPQDKHLINLNKHQELKLLNSS